MLLLGRVPRLLSRRNVAPFRRSLVCFGALERLDVSHCFRCEFCDGDAPAPYDAGLSALASALPNLTQIDLGYGDESDSRDFWGSCVSEACSRSLSESHPTI